MACPVVAALFAGGLFCSDSGDFSHEFSGFAGQGTAQVALKSISVNFKATLGTCPAIVREFQIKTQLIHQI